MSEWDISPDAPTDDGNGVQIGSGVVTIPAAELAALRRDAQRYRWLRGRCRKSGRIDFWAVDRLGGAVDFAQLVREAAGDLDAAIDAARGEAT